MGCPAEVFCRKYIKYIDGGSIVAYHGIFFALLVIFFEILAAPKLRWFDVVWVTAGGPFMISMLGASACMFCANLGTNMNFEGQTSPDFFFQKASRKPIWILDRFLTTKRMKHLTSWCMKSGWERFPYNFQFVSWAPFADKNHHTHFSSGGPRLTHAKHSVYALRCFEDTFLTIIESPRCSYMLRFMKVEAVYVPMTSPTSPRP